MVAEQEMIASLLWILKYETNLDDGLEPSYEGKDVSFSDEFDIEIQESGTYIVTVTGKKAKKSIMSICLINMRRNMARINSIPVL